MHILFTIETICIVHVIFNTDVSIGFERTSYTASENEQQTQVCIIVQGGTVRTSAVVRVRTENDTAIGEKITVCYSIS